MKQPYYSMTKMRPKLMSTFFQWETFKESQSRLDFDEQFMNQLWRNMKNKPIHAFDKEFKYWHPEFLFTEEAICQTCKVNECRHLPKIDRRTYHEDQEIGEMLQQIMNRDRNMQNTYYFARVNKYQQIEHCVRFIDPKDTTRATPGMVFVCVVALLSAHDRWKKIHERLTKLNQERESRLREK